VIYSSKYIVLLNSNTILIPIASLLSFNNNNFIKNVKKNFIIGLINFCCILQFCYTPKILWFCTLFFVLCAVLKHLWCVGITNTWACTCTTHKMVFIIMYMLTCSLLRSTMILGWSSTTSSLPLYERDLKLHFTGLNIFSSGEISRIFALFCILF
jgi:hypothetical protein